jgi:hypothetical protein
LARQIANINHELGRNMCNALHVICAVHYIERPGNPHRMTTAEASFSLGLCKYRICSRIRALLAPSESARLPTILPVGMAHISGQIADPRYSKTSTDLTDSKTRYRPPVAEPLSVLENFLPSSNMTDHSDFPACGLQHLMRNYINCCEST